MATKAPTTRRRPHDLGTVERLPSGRYRAFYRVGPDKFTAPRTFTDKGSAHAWLAAERSARVQGTWRDPSLGQVTLAEYATGWLAARTDLAARTHDLYTRHLARRILAPVGDPAAGQLDLGAVALAQLTPALVRTWWARMAADCARDATARRTSRRTWTPGSTHGPHPARAWARAQGMAVADRGRLSPRVLAAWTAAGRPDPAAGPADPNAGRTAAAQAYRLLHAILATATSDGLIPTNPAQVKGAATVAHAERQPATRAEVDALAAAMPDHLATAVHLAAWSGLRQGELLALSRRHVDLAAGSVRVDRALARDGTFTRPKTRASVRTVYLPRFVTDALAAHLDAHTDPSPDALVFATATGDPIRPQRLLAAFDRARQRVQRPTLTWHDLRHTGATLAYAAGGSVRDVQHRLGHATTRAAMIYAHAADDSDRHLAARLDAAYATGSTPAAAASWRPGLSPAPLTDPEPAPEIGASSRPEPRPATRQPKVAARRRHLSVVPDLPTTTEWSA